MRVRFQADADLDGRVIRGLKRAAPEIDGICVESKSAGLDDLEVLRISSATDRILVSQDRRTMPGNFRRHIVSATSPDVIPPGISIAAAIDEIVLIWSASQPAEWTNRLVWIPL